MHLFQIINTVDSIMLRIIYQMYMIQLDHQKWTNITISSR